MTELDRFPDSQIQVAEKWQFVRNDHNVQNERNEQKDAVYALFLNSAHSATMSHLEQYESGIPARMTGRSVNTVNHAKTRLFQRFTKIRRQKQALLARMCRVGVYAPLRYIYATLLLLLSF